MVYMFLSTKNNVVLVNLLTLGGLRGVGRGGGFEGI